MRTYTTIHVVCRNERLETIWELTGMKFLATELRYNDVFDCCAEDAFRDGEEVAPWAEVSDVHFNAVDQHWFAVGFMHCDNVEERNYAVFSRYRSQLLGANWLITEEEPPPIRKVHHAKAKKT